MSDLRELLVRTANEIADHRERLRTGPVFPDVDRDELRSGFAPAGSGGAGSVGRLPAAGVDAAQVIDELVAAATPGLVGTAGPRYFGFVIGGSVDAATAADMLAVGWDQVAFNEMSSPAAAAVEEVAGEWLKDLLGIPSSASFGFVTGAQGANTVALAAARHHVLGRAGHDVERDGLIGAPRIRVVGSVERHATIDRSLQLLGLGSALVEPVESDANGAMDVAALRAVLDAGPSAPTIVVSQAGNVNTGACDDLAAVVDAARAHDAWVHVDGAFGLWAAASPSTRSQVAGLEGADSWGCDGHKWLNVPYDSGYVFCAHPDAHAASMTFAAAYLSKLGSGEVRSPSDFVTESSRRARGFATWAALRELGRDGVTELVDRCCGLARRAAELLSAHDGIEIANEVVLNQVLVRFGGDDSVTDRVIAAVQQSGECWLGGTTWHGRRLMRISVSNAFTTDADIDRSVAAILDAFRRDAFPTDPPHRADPGAAG